MTKEESIENEFAWGTYKNHRQELTPEELNRWHNLNAKLDETIKRKETR